MFVSYPDVCWCQLISPSITGLRHDRSGCALLPGARSAHERRDEAHDPRPSRSDTSPPISQAVPGLQSGSDETHFVPPSSRETKPGTKLSLLNVPTPTPVQNSPCTGKTAQIPRFWASRANFVTDMPRSSSTGHVLSDHKLYARTLTHRLTRPPATPSMGGRHTRGQRGLAAVPVGGGGAWPGFEIDHSEPKARVWRSRGRAAAHGHTKQPDRGHGHTKQPDRGHGPPTGTQNSPAAARAHNEAATGFPATASLMNER